MVRPEGITTNINPFVALDEENDFSEFDEDLETTEEEGPTTPAIAAVPTSRTAQRLLFARIDEGSTTIEDRASDPVYVENLVQALRDRARALARVRQHVENIKRENARRANEIGDACYGVEPLSKDGGDYAPMPKSKGSGSA